MNADAGLVAYQASGRLRQIRRFNQLAIVFFMYPPSQHLQNQLVICLYISLHKVCEILASTGERVSLSSHLKQKYIDSDMNGLHCELLQE